MCILQWTVGIKCKKCLFKDRILMDFLLQLLEDCLVMYASSSVAYLLLLLG